MIKTKYDLLICLLMILASQQVPDIDTGQGPLKVQPQIRVADGGSRTYCGTAMFGRSTGCGYKQLRPRSSREGQTASP